ncbi:sensor histidine kinase [Asticcacaulis sp. 201]|uniref:sensor histidine kinase n=1 Tax=Asticcacaulis sp. 201 TaxID=3028787 RepID=UPI0029169E48|nr:ATP-binding protein [Asticcacaulis sp. 201]MDV6332790.1 PAS domain S-box protein [Asticcacaulis sp. 201]
MNKTADLASIVPPTLVWLHSVADIVITLSCFVMAGALFFVRFRRPDLTMRSLFTVFGTLMLLAGITALADIWTLWRLQLLVDGVVRIIYAIAVFFSCIALTAMVPRALKITSARQLADANRKLERLYRATEEQGRMMLGAVVDNIIDGIITIDDHNRIQSFNPACETLFGYTSDEVVGQPVSLLMPNPTYAEHDHYILQYVGTAAGGREVMARRRDGSEFSADLSVSAFEISGRRHYTGIIRDITKAKQAEEARQKLLKRLTDSNTELERFAYVASHDMQEPLRMVINFSQVIRNDYDDKLDDDGREYLKIIGDAAARMRDMVQDLLEYARLDKEVARFAPVDLRAELAHVLKNLRALTRESQAIITYDDLPVVEGSGVQLMRLMQNLISNAIKYQRPRRLPVVHVGCQDRGDHWEISVRDNGMGVDQPFINQIFEPFRRLHSWDNIPGTGLGLSVCRKIAETHGGHIWAVSEPDVGSTFFFTLPKISHTA